MNSKTIHYWHYNYNN